MINRIREYVRSSAWGIIVVPFNRKPLIIHPLLVLAGPLLWYVVYHGTFAVLGTEHLATQSSEAAILLRRNIGAVAGLPVGMYYALLTRYSFGFLGLNVLAVVLPVPAWMPKKAYGLFRSPTPERAFSPVPPAEAHWSFGPHFQNLMIVGVPTFVSFIITYKLLNWRLSEEKKKEMDNKYLYEFQKDVLDLD